MKFAIAFCVMAVLVHMEVQAQDPADESQLPRICEPGSIFMEDCNTCRCSIDGTDKACTRINCVKIDPDVPVRERRSPQDTQTCVPGTKFKIDCNDCVCTEAGVPVCTLMACV